MDRVSRSADVFIVATEPSGDQLGAGLANALHEQDPDLHIEAIGGSRLSETGYPSHMDIDGLAILGFVEGLRAYPHVLKKVGQTTDIILENNPKSVVLIDSWGFMVRVAKRLKSRGYSGQIIKFVAPQVWAMRAGRAKILAQYVDHLLSIQPMDAPFFDAVGLPQTYVGNPVFDTDYKAGDGEAFIRRHGLDPTRPILGIFPGSRDSELDRMLGVIESNIMALTLDVPDLQTVYVLADAVWEDWYNVVKTTSVKPAKFVRQDEMLDAFAAIDAAHAVSGTITTQLACAGVPTVVIYRLAGLTYTVGKQLFKPDFISIVNIAAERELMPEFIQEDAGGWGPVTALANYLTNEDAAEQASAALLDQTHRMGAGEGSASFSAAKAVLSLIR